MTSRFRLTQRDYEILKFLYDQKFCSLEALYFRFFDQRPSPTDPIPAQMPAARQRLGILKRAQLIKTQKVYTEAKSVYLIDKKGFEALSGRYPAVIYGPPVREVDFRNYDHDRRLNLVRVALERAGKVVRWYPERRIRMHGFQVPEVRGELPKSIVPDGIFLSPQGKRVAVEVEISIRKKSRFRSKIRELDYVMHMSNPPLIHRVLFVPCSDALGKDLSELIGGNSGFLLEAYPYFINHLKAKARSGTDTAEESNDVE